MKRSRGISGSKTLQSCSVVPSIIRARPDSANPNSPIPVNRLRSTPRILNLQICQSWQSSDLSILRISRSVDLSILRKTDPSGIELMTFRVETQHSTNWAVETWTAARETEMIFPEKNSKKKRASWNQWLQEEVMISWDPFSWLIDRSMGQWWKQGRTNRDTTAKPQQIDAQRHLSYLTVPWIRQSRLQWIYRIRNVTWYWLAIIFSDN